MTSAWLLPEHIAMSCVRSAAIEELAAKLLDLARSYVSSW